uniref:Putative LOC100575639 [Acyrthosiphon pisum] n=1 Tax=Lepeophtheirus salmonis TaxID=72036 RepID=A0A0K2UM95_LEPSM
MNDKLTPKHFNCVKNERQHVHLVTPLFSKRSAMSLCLLFPHEEDSQNVANFVDLINSWFDVMNSLGPNDSKNDVGSGFGKYLEKQKKVLVDTIKIISSVRQLPVTSNKKTKLKPYQKGIIISSKSLMNLHGDLTSQNTTIEYILSPRCNQDIIEKKFSRIRGIGRFHQHPNSVEYMD